MESVEDNLPNCALKCLRNVEDVSSTVHPLKYGVNTIGRALNNDITLKNLNVSRTHCHLRVEKIESKNIAYIKDLGTSNGTMVGNINLVEFEEHQLNDLDMIVLASGDEGVVLQYINNTDCIINFSNLSMDQISNKRKVPCTESLDEPTAVKMPKLVLDEPNVFKEPVSHKSIHPSEKLLNSSNITNNVQHTNINQSTSTGGVFKPLIKSSCQILPIDNSKIVPLNNTKPSSSHYKDNNKLTSVKVKTEPGTTNNVLSQGTYRNEEDSVIVIYSSDEENDLELPNIKIKLEQTHTSTSNTNLYPSTSKVETNPSIPEWSIRYQRNEIVSEDEDDDVIYIPPTLNSENNNVLMSSSDSDSEFDTKCPKIIDPLPMRSIKQQRQTNLLMENKNIIKTRAKSEKRINNKKIASQMTIDQNKQIIQERRLQLAKNKSSSSSEKTKLNNNSLTNDDNIDKSSTIETLNRRTRISRLQKADHDSAPSTSKSHSAIEVEKNNTLSIEKKLKFNYKEITSKIDTKIPLHSSTSIKDSSSIKMDHNNFSYFDTISKICKWNAVWLYEEKFVDRSPPLVKTINKMKGEFENPSEYSSTVKPLLFYEIWSKISESYNMIISKNPNLEKCIFEKALKKNIPLLTFSIKSVNTNFSSSVQALKSISEPLWCLKCIETNKKDMETLTGPRFSLKGYLCIAIIQSNCFETDAVTVKKPTKSRNIFFAYVNLAKKIGFHSSTQSYIELIATRKTENIPVGTTIYLMDIFYLHSELRLFQAVNNVTTSSLNKALITPQLHDCTIDYAKANLKNYNINNLMLNNSQKEAVKMAVTICSAKEPNVGLIIGPPGTGKTNVIYNIILTLMSKLQSKTNTRPKLLVCAPSNEAVDSIIRRVIKFKKDLKNDLQFNIVRVGGIQKYDPNSPIVEVMLDTMVKQRMKNGFSEADQGGQTNKLSIFTNKKEIEEHILKNADVILTTLNSCFSKTMENAFLPSVKTLNCCHFTACIVDEAGQCVEPLNYVPLLLGIDKLILVGDDKQLQPLIRSKVAKDNGFAISLFKRLKHWFEFSCGIKKNVPVKMLDIQYRMHHEICLFPSAYFYKNLIKTAPSVKTRKQLPFQPYLILEHDSQQDNSGEINVGEAHMVVNLIEIFLNSECKSLNIAVLTPYHKQRELINKTLENKKISLNVNTIDSFQGGECDVLLISVVRTNGIGFMDDICRLNVALTRARQSLIICGNFMSLKGERVWCDLLEDAKKRKLIKKVSKYVIGNSRTLSTLIKY